MQYCSNNPIISKRQDGDYYNPNLKKKHIFSALYCADPNLKNNFKIKFKHDIFL